MGFLRVLFVVLLVLVAIYLVLSVWLRLRERRRLAEEWEAGDRLVARDIFMEEGMADYDRSLRKRLLWLVIVMPMAGLMILLYLLNVS
jgi:Mg2+/citrate symporter